MIKCLFYVWKGLRVLNCDFIESSIIYAEPLSPIFRSPVYQLLALDAKEFFVPHV